MVDTFSSYRSMFVHRSDVFAEQQSSGAYLPVRRPLSLADISDHLAGRKSYGVYVIEPAQRPTRDGSGRVSDMPANTVRYVVFDLDTYDAGALDFLERAVERLLMGDGLGIRLANAERKCLLLEDSGGKGYHIWLLLDAPVAAAQVRAWTKPIRDAYAEHAGLLMAPVKPWPALEVFPKQDAVPKDRPCSCKGQRADCPKCHGTGIEPGFGNLVKLPLGRHAVTHANSYFLRRAGWAMGVDEVVPFPSVLIPDAAPAAKSSAGTDESAGRTAFACINELLEHGAPDGCRDKAMYFLARFWRSSGLNERQVGDACLDANERFEPELPAHQVEKCVRSAFAAEFARPRCGEDWHGSFCPGSDRMRGCPNYRGSDEGGTLDEDPLGDLSPEERQRRLREGYGDQ